jgi:hypothetical protein
MPLDQVAHDGKPDSAAGSVRPPVSLQPYELLPDRLALGHRNPRPLILDLETRRARKTRQANEYLLTRRAVANGVIEKVQQHLPQRIRVDRRHARLEIHRQASLSHRRERRKRVHDLGDETRELVGLQD